MFAEVSVTVSLPPVCPTTLPDPLPSMVRPWKLGSAKLEVPLPPYWVPRIENSAVLFVIGSI
jgi:hypothetical protein